jgi:hypothetical protein
MLCSGSHRVPPLDKSLDSNPPNRPAWSVSPGQKADGRRHGGRRWAVSPKVMSLTVDSGLTSVNTPFDPRSLEDPKVHPGNDRGPLRSLGKGL